MTCDGGYDQQSVCCSSAAAQPHRTLSLHSVALHSGPTQWPSGSLSFVCSHCRSPSQGAPLPPAVSQALEACLTWSPGSHVGLPPNALQASLWVSAVPFPALELGWPVSEVCLCSDTTVGFRVLCGP